MRGTGTIAAGILVLCMITSGCTNHEPSPPNVLVILADDLGWNQLGCYGGPYLTPAIDSLASQGTRFTSAYASAAVCSPTRAALMTGKYPARLHITDFITGQAFPDSLLEQPDWQKYLPLEEVTLAEIFKNQGYRTAFFGKWHLSQEKKPPGSEPFNPDKQGFGEYMITYKPISGITDTGHDPHNTDSITRRSVRFLQEKGDRPFFLVVSHNAIHDPLMESQVNIDAYLDRYPEPPFPVKPEVGAMVARLDRSVSALMESLEELGLSRQTIVVFCSDNGGKEAHASQYPFRKGKGWLHEGGIRVPLIVRWPGRIVEGSRIHRVNATIDLFPTILELAGMGVPGSPDGISLAGELLGTGSPGDRALFWHYPHYHGGSGMKPASALRSGKYKLIEWHEEYLSGEHAWELYDLENDQGELLDLSTSYPALLDSLKRKLHGWRDEVGAQMPSLKE